MTPFEAAKLMHVLANTWGVCHSVSVYVPEPAPMAVVGVPLFGADVA